MRRDPKMTSLQRAVHLWIPGECDQDPSSNVHLVSLAQNVNLAIGFCAIAAMYCDYEKRPDPAILALYSSHPDTDVHLCPDCLCGLIRCSCNRGHDHRPFLYCVRHEIDLAALRGDCNRDQTLDLGLDRGHDLCSRHEILGPVHALCYPLEIRQRNWHADQEVARTCLSGLEVACAL